MDNATLLRLLLLGGALFAVEFAAVSLLIELLPWGIALAAASPIAAINLAFVLWARRLEARKSRGG